MDLLSLRDRIRNKAIANGLTYTEIETLFDVNELLNQTMPCLAWRYSGERNDFSQVGTEMSLNIYLLTEFPDSVKTETADYQRDYIVTQQNALRTFFYDWLQDMPYESGDDFLEVVSTEETPIAERLGIEGLLTMEFRTNISIKRSFCVDPEDIPSVNQVQVYFNSVLKYTQGCNHDLILTLKNQDGDDIDATFNGYDIVVNQLGADASVSNSDDSYDVSVASGGALELPDETITINSNSFITKPSVKNQDILLKDVSGNTITPESLAGNTITLLDPVTIKGAKPTQTGQTVSYAANDDGALQRGRLVDFFTLPYNNGFGTTERFTDNLGGQTYANNIVIDWSTWDGGSGKVMGYCYSPFSNFTGTRNRTDWGLNAPYTCDGFGGFYLINENMRNSISNLDLSSGFNGAPFNLAVAGFLNRFYTSSTISNGNAVTQSHNSPVSSILSPTSALRAMLYRDFTFNGTTLT